MSIAYQRKRKVGIKHEENRKAFIDYSQTVGDVSENLEDYLLTKKSVNSL